MPTPIGELARKSTCLLKTETENDSASSEENNFKSYNYKILPTPIGELAHKSTCLLKTETETETDSASSAENNFKSYNYSLLPTAYWNATCLLKTENWIVEIRQKKRIASATLFIIISTSNIS